MTVFSRGNPPHGFAVRFELHILGRQKIFLDNRRSQQIDLRGGGGFDIIHHFVHQGGIGFEVHSLRRVVEAVPDIVDAARNRHYRRLPVDDVLLQSSGHVGRLVTADAGVEDLYLEIRIVAVQDLFHESEVTSRLRDAVPESHNSVAGFQFHLALGRAVKYFCEDGESHQVFQVHGRPLF